MTPKKSFLPFILTCALLTAVSARAEESGADAEDANFDYRTVTTSEGLTFRVPEDMPIETRGGIQAPIPFDEYMYGKFSKLEKRLQEIESKLDRIEKLLLAQQADPAGTQAIVSR